MSLKEKVFEITYLQELYHKKNEYLLDRYERVDQRMFYRDLFPIGSFERQGIYEDAKPNGLVLDIRGKGEAYHYIITDEHEEFESIQKCGFVIMSPIGYFGLRRSGKNARYLYAYTFDLDGVEMVHLADLINQMNQGILPKATYIVNSGTGLHLYYIFKDPIPLYPFIQKKLKDMKYALIDRIWNKYTSSQKEPQKQGIMQGFRMVGSPSKMGSSFPVVAYKFGDRLTLDYFNDFVPESEKITDIKYKSVLSLEEAKNKYPEWYDKRIVRGERRGRWVVKRDLYDWWKQRIKKEIVVGHRFYGIFMLAIYAKKCNINEDELRSDAYTIMSYFDSLSINPDNRFTEDDVVAALEVYNESYVTFPREDISKLSGLTIVANKRNGYPRDIHLEIQRAKKKAMKRAGVMKQEGRPSARQNVLAYMISNSDARKCDVIKALGLSKKTVYKYYDEIKLELKT